MLVRRGKKRGPYELLGTHTELRLAHSRTWDPKMQEGILRSFRLYVIFRACPGNVVM